MALAFGETLTFKFILFRFEMFYLLSLNVSLLLIVSSFISLEEFYYYWVNSSIAAMKFCPSFVGGAIERPRLSFLTVIVADD